MDAERALTGRTESVGRVKITFCRDETEIREDEEKRVSVYKHIQLVRPLEDTFHYIFAILQIMLRARNDIAVEYSLFGILGIWSQTVR